MKVEVCTADCNGNVESHLSWVCLNCYDGLFKKERQTTQVKIHSSKVTSSFAFTTDFGNK